MRLTEPIVVEPQIYCMKCKIRERWLLSKRTKIARHLGANSSDSLESLNPWRTNVYISRTPIESRRGEDASDIQAYCERGLHLCPQQLTLNRRVQGSSPCAPTNQTIEIPELNSCAAVLQAFAVVGRVPKGFQRLCAKPQGARPE
jgi:hypothetical protein